MFAGQATFRVLHERLSLSGALRATPYWEDVQVLIVIGKRSAG